METAIREYAPHLIGQDPAGPERHWSRLYNAWRWRGGAVFSTAMSAIDIALWDLEGKRLGVPVARLLGGAQRTKLRGYASHWLSGVTTPEQAHAGAKEAVKRGFTAFKCRPFSFEGLRDNEAREIRRAAELLAAAREGAGPDVDIFIECSEFLSPRTAVMMDEALRPSRPGWFEEPIPFENAKVMARLQRQIKTPIATGERLLSRFEYREILEKGGCKIIQPDLMHAGGFTEIRRSLRLADTYYSRWRRIIRAGRSAPPPPCISRRRSRISTSWNRWSRSAPRATRRPPSRSASRTAASFCPKAPASASSPISSF